MKKINLFIIFILYLLICTLNIYLVFNFGRLNFELYVDDVGYALSALKSLISQNQIWINDFINSHSPYQFFIGSIGLMLFGYNDYSIYLANLIPLFFLAVLIYWKFRNENIFLFFFIALYILSSPFVYRLVNEFRPDIFYGIILTYALNLAIFSNLKDIKSNFLLIILITSSLLIKPTFVIHSFFYIFIIIVLVNFRNNFNMRTFYLSVRNYIIIPLILSIIFFIKRYKGIIDHYINSFKSQGFTFEKELDFIDLLHFNLLDTDYGMVFIGYNLYVFFILFFISLFLLKNKKHNKELIKILIIPIVGFLSFLILCQTKVINQHVYSTFHFSVIFSSAILLSFFWKNFNLIKINRLLFIYPFIIMSILNIQFYKFNTFGVLSNFEKVTIGKSDNKEVISIINDNILNKEDSNKNIDIYVPFYTPINFLSLNWYYSLSENRNKNYKVNFLFENPNIEFDQIKNKLKEIDILILPKIDSIYLFKFFEINQFLNFTYDEINDRNNYNFKIFQNNDYYIYSKL